MKNFLKWIANKYHNHEYEVIEKNELTKHKYDPWTGDIKFTYKGTRYILQCKICGEIIKRDII